MPAQSARSTIAVLLVLVAACSRHQAPESAPAPAAEPGVVALPPDSSKVLATYDQIVNQVEAGDESFMRMSIAAAAWIGHLVPGKSIGFYQPELATPAFRDMVEEVTRRYAFRPVRAVDFRYGCDQRTGACAMAMADAIAAFSSTRMSIDSGYVGGSITQIPRGGNGPETKAFCITIARHGSDWKAVRSTWVPTAQQCPPTKS